VSDRASLKWRDLVSADTPLPTPWPKDEYERYDDKFADTYFELRKHKAAEQDVDKLIFEAVPKAVEILDRSPFSKRTGAFEGAENESCGAFRPQVNCIMFTLTPRNFCSVCREAILRAIHFYDH
jgi:hypothetical protein